MKNYRPYLLLLLAIAFMAGLYSFSEINNQDDRFISFTINPKKQDLKLYYKDEKQRRFGSIQNLKDYLNKRHLKLEFAMNGGMYKKDGSPQGLYIEGGKILSAADTTSGNGNFYLKPNGVFYISHDKTAGISTTLKFKNTGVDYATQSGPMLLIDGVMHPAFKQGSANVQIRNGVGILPGNKVVFAMSKESVNFYDFALYFKNLGCKDALYLDGFVSRTYLPAQKWLQTDGDFGVIIGSASK